ncbi:uncharacterized protein LOC124168671 [Ischnura elegans]|uniref:uncharacterized protein LOC124168671 n=1 Tax=Ischnura elegans TaxID=197161 RepID=UPI001ED86EBE|nr:uncharacterized protein LOC124168671 [Ischnura elegans]
MVNNCCVPHYRRNYVGGEKVSVFRFPDDELLKMKWTRSIHRTNFTPTTYSRVCIKHFMSEDVLWETSMFDESTGKLITVKLPAPRLREGAVPSVFPERPSCTSVNARLEPEEKRRKKEMEQLEKCIRDSIEERRLYEEARSFKTLGDCFEKLQKCVYFGDFSFIKKKDKLLLCHIIADPFSVMKACVIIDRDLMLNVFMDHAELKKIGNFIFPMYVKDTNTVNEVLAGLTTLISDKPLPNSSMVDKLGVILQLLDSLNASDDFVDTVNFLTEKIKLMMSSKHSYRYRSETFVFCSIFFTISPHAYKFVRSSDMFQLPHPPTIRQVCASYNLSPQRDLTHNLAYSKTVFSTLKINERHVVLMMDEINVKS